MTAELAVVIPTHQRRDLLVRVLAALAAQTMARERFTVTVVCDGCHDGSADAARLAVAEDGQAAGLNLRVMEQPNAGAATARNRGAGSTHAGLLLFLDDDMIAQPDLLAVHLKQHHRRPGTIVIGHLPVHPDSPQSYLTRGLARWVNRRHELLSRAGIPVPAIEKLAAADAFRSLGLDRRDALWQAKALAKAKPLPLFQLAGARDAGKDLPVTLPRMPLPEHVVNDYQTLKLSLKGHPMEFLRHLCNEHYVTDNERLKQKKDGSRVTVAGVVLVRQRPGSAKGVVFITLEDEFTVCNAIIWSKVLEAYRPIVMGARLMLIQGRIQRTDEIIHVVAGKVEDRTPWLSLLSDNHGRFENPLARADEIKRPGYDHRMPAARHPRNVRVIPKSRDFH